MKYYDLQRKHYTACSRARHLTTAKRQFLAPPALRKALEQVQCYAERHQERWDRIREAGVDVSLVKDACILTGKIDLIRGENDAVEIVDFKTEKKPDLITERNVLDRYRRQLEVYGQRKSALAWR